MTRFQLIYLRKSLHIPESAGVQMKAEEEIQVGKGETNITLR